MSAAFRDDYEEHILHGRCTASLNQPVPCVSMCPAGVDIPGYIALVKEGRNADAVRLIRKDNPFPTVCAFICEHPCEARCRRNMLDDSINIRGIKRYAVDHAGHVPAETRAPATGKRVAIVGGGPGGSERCILSAADGPSERRITKNANGWAVCCATASRIIACHANGWMRRSMSSLSTGVEVHTETDIGKDVTLAQLDREFDAVYLAIGAQTDKKVGIPGEDGENVISAVTMLRNIGDDILPDFQGQTRAGHRAAAT